MDSSIYNIDFKYFTTLLISLPLLISNYGRSRWFVPFPSFLTNIFYNVPFHICLHNYLGILHASMRHANAKLRGFLIHPSYFRTSILKWKTYILKYSFQNIKKLDQIFGKCARNLGLWLNLFLYYFDLVIEMSFIMHTISCMTKPTKHNRVQIGKPNLINRIT